MARGGYVPDWQRALIALSATVVAAAVITALYWARSIFIPVALAIFLTFVLSPVVVWFGRRGLGRTPSVILTVGLALLISGGLGALIAQQVASLSDDLTQPDKRARLIARLEEAKRTVVGTGDSRLGQLIDDVTQIVVPKPKKTDPNAPEVVITSVGPSWMAQFGTLASPAVEVLGQAAFAFLLTVFMLLKKEDLRNRIIRLTGHGKVTTTTKAVDDASRRVSKFLFTQLLLNTAFALVILAGLLILEVDYALLWAVIAFLMRYVPYIGTWIGLIPPVVYTLGVSEGWGQPIAVVGLFVGLELLCNNVFEPMLYGPSMGLSEVAQLVAAGFWAFLWGPIGLILSGPLTVVLLVLGKYVARFQFLEVLLGDEPALAPRVAFYQRLTARDEDEASRVALKEARAEGATAEGVLDTVIVPALCLAKRDHADGDLSADDLKFAVRAAREVAEDVVAEKPAVEAGAEAATGKRVRVLLCPARDEIDHVGIDLLAHLLDPTRWEIEVAPDEVLASELLARIEAFRPAAVVIGAVPPGGLAHTRYLVARVRGRFPEVKVVVGRWGRGDDFPDDPDQAKLPGADFIDDTLTSTRKRLAEWYAVLAAGEAAELRSEKTRAVGTPGASESERRKESVEV